MCLTILYLAWLASPAAWLGEGVGAGETACKGWQSAITGRCLLVLKAAKRALKGRMMCWNTVPFVSAGTPQIVASAKL